MKIKKFTVIAAICLIVMIIGNLLLYNLAFCNMLSQWVLDGAGNGKYTVAESELYSNLMIIFILGMPFFAGIICIISAVKRNKLKKRLEREGRYDEYRELFGND